MKGPEYYDKIYEKDYNWEAYRSLYERVAGYLPKKKDARILDAACGVGGFLKVCEEKGYTNLSGFDFSKKAIERAKELVANAHLGVRDINLMPEKWQCDCAVIIETLEHLEHDVKVVKMLLDFCTKDGYVLGAVPNEQMGPEVTEGHLRVYDERTFMERFNLPGRIAVKTNFLIFKFWKNLPKPLISFVVPAYMGDHYLNETIQSLVNQTEERIEIIVVDDGSQDYTEDLMKWWVKNDGRIRYYHLPENKGVVYARNFGNRKARAEIIGVTDQDDLSMPERAKITVDTFRKKPKINILYSSYHECDVDGEPLTFYEAEKMNRDIFEQKKWKTWFHSSAAYRKKDILRLPYKKRDGCTDDWILLDTWTKAGMVFHPIKEVLANCRRLPTGVMAQRRKQAGAGPNYFL